MTVEYHEHPEIVRQIDGFGGRVNRIEVDMATCQTKVERSEDDITKLFQLVGETAKSAQVLEKSVAGLLGKMSGIAAATAILIPIVMKLTERFILK